MSEIPTENPHMEQRIEGDKVVIKTTLWVEYDHLGRPWRIPVMAPRSPATSGREK